MKIMSNDNINNDNNQNNNIDNNKEKLKDSRESLNILKKRMYIRILLENVRMIFC